MTEGLLAKASITIGAPKRTVWGALVNPKVIRQYMFGTNVISEWKVGSSIVWRGTWQGKSYEDKGVILKLEPGSAIQYSHFSPLSGLPDLPENYHTVTIRLTHTPSGTKISLVQDNNPTEEARDHSEKNWETMLRNLKKAVEEEEEEEEL